MADKTTMRMRPLSGNVDVIAVTAVSGWYLWMAIARLINSSTGRNGCYFLDVITSLRVWKG